MKWSIQSKGTGYREDLAYICEGREILEVANICFSAGATEVTVAPVKNDRVFATQTDLYNWVKNMGITP